MQTRQALQHYQTVTTANVELLSAPGSPENLIRQVLLRVVEDELGDSRQWGCLVANASLELAGQDEAVARLVSDNFQRLQTSFEQMIERGQRSGDVCTGKNARALARFFVSTIQGLRVLSKGTPAGERRECLFDVVDVALDTL